MGFTWFEVAGVYPEGASTRAQVRIAFDMFVAHADEDTIGSRIVLHLDRHDRLRAAAGEKKNKC